MGGCLTVVRLWGDEGVRISRLNTGLGGHNLHKTERIHNFNELWGFKSPASIGSKFCVGVKSPEVLWTETVPTNFSSLQNVIANCELVLSAAEVLRIANCFNWCQFKIINITGN
jgi:hypothetical protein